MATVEFLHDSVFSSNFLHEPNSTSQETNQIMSISGALDMARELGVDVILINEARAADDESVYFSWHQARHPVKFNLNFRILPLSVSTSKDQDPPLVKIASARAQSLPL
jgi:hypothetical protein